MFTITNPIRLVSTVAGAIACFAVGGPAQGFAFLFGIAVGSLKFN
jgi:hypothetical protein